MSRTGFNLGENSTVAIFVEGQQLGRDFLNVIKFDHDDKHAEGMTAHLNRSAHRPWKRYTHTEGNLGLETQNDGYIQQVIDALDKAEATRQEPDIKLVETTENADGTVSQITWINCVLTGKKSNNGKVEKQTRDFTWKGVNQAKIR